MQQYGLSSVFFAANNQIEAVHMQNLKGIYRSDRKSPEPSLLCHVSAETMKKISENTLGEGIHVAGMYWHEKDLFLFHSQNGP